MSLRSVSSESIEEPARWGVAATLWARLMRRLHRWLILCRIQARDLPHGRAPTELEDGFSLRIASRAELDRAALELPDQLSREFIDAATSRGDLCFAVFQGETIVAWVWRSFSTAPHADGLWVRVDRPNCYSYKSYTRPSLRGRRLIGRLTLYADQVCRERGCEHSVGFIETHNYASIRANTRLGSRRVGFAGYVKVLGKSYPFRTPGVVPHTFRFYRHAEATVP
jgi:GNAT superfamily N-acetyltransferase